MIIIDQDKNKIINFDNVNEILTTDTGKILVINNIHITDDCLDVLGKYDTEERAKEVLQEIVSKYKTTLYNSKTNETVVNAPKVYEMPTK